MEVGYIKIEDFLELIKLADRVLMETNHYVSICYGPTCIDVDVMKNGFTARREFDFSERFIMYDPWVPKRDAEKFKEVKNYLKGLLGENNG